MKQSSKVRIKTSAVEATAEGVQADYVRVKAGRGQATDSHSVAERERRAKIRMKMKVLQSIVPGCDKITGKAHILEEIIKYVRMMQNQIECLAANLASVDLMLYDCDYTRANPCVSEGIDLYCLEPSMPSLPDSSSIPFVSFADAEPNNFNSLSLTEDQKASLLLQDGEDFLLDMEDHYCEDIVDQPGLDNSCSFLA